MEQSDKTESDHLLVHWRISRDLLDRLREVRDEHRYRPTIEGVAVVMLACGLDYFPYEDGWRDPDRTDPDENEGREPDSIETEPDHQLVHWRIPRDLLDRLREARDEHRYRPTIEGVAVVMLACGLDNFPEKEYEDGWRDPDRTDPDENEGREPDSIDLDEDADQ